MSDSAFPDYVNWPRPAGGAKAEGGLTKRELFAAMAMQGLIAGCEAAQQVFFADIAKASVEQADALLAELAKERP